MLFLQCPLLHQTAASAVEFRSFCNKQATALQPLGSGWAHRAAWAVAAPGPHSSIALLQPAINAPLDLLKDRGWMASSQRLRLLQGEPHPAAQCLLGFCAGSG